MVVGGTGGQATCQLEQVPENPPACPVVAEAAHKLHRPFLLKGETEVWFFPVCVLESGNRVCLYAVMGVKKRGAFSSAVLSICRKA